MPADAALVSTPELTLAPLQGSPGGSSARHEVTRLSCRFVYITILVQLPQTKPRLLDACGQLDLALLAIVFQRWLLTTLTFLASHSRFLSSFSSFARIFFSVRSRMRAVRSSRGRLLIASFSMSISSDKGIRSSAGRSVGEKTFAASARVNWRDSEVGLRLKRVCGSIARTALSASVVSRASTHNSSHSAHVDAIQSTDSPRSGHSDCGSRCLAGMVADRIASLAEGRFGSLLPSPPSPDFGRARQRLTEDATRSVQPGEHVAAKTCRFDLPEVRHEAASSICYDSGRQEMACPKTYREAAVDAATP
ncbi:hypothetical protein KCU61_g198, partial [Aureobasidium melanogenum]